MEQSKIIWKIYVYMKYYYNICLQDSILYNKRLIFKSYGKDFLIWGGQDAHFFSGLTSVLIPHRLLRPRHPSLTPKRSVIYLRCSGGETGTTCPLAPKVGPQSLSPKGVITLPGQPVTRRVRITMEPTMQNRQAQIEVVPSASALIINTLKEPPRDGKKNIKRSEKIALLVRLSIFPDRRSTDLWPEICQKPLKRS